MRLSEQLIFTRMTFTAAGSALSCIGLLWWGGLAWRVLRRGRGARMTYPGLGAALVVAIFSAGLRSGAGVLAALAPGHVVEVVSAGFGLAAGAAVMVLAVMVQQNRRQLEANVDAIARAEQTWEEEQ